MRSKRSLSSSSRTFFGHVHEVLEIVFNPLKKIHELLDGLLLLLILYVHHSVPVKKIDFLFRQIESTYLWVIPFHQNIKEGVPLH